MTKHEDIIIKPYTHQELANLYGTTWRTLQKWIKPFRHLLGEKSGHYYSARQVKIIFTRLGWPLTGETDSKAAA